MSSLSTLYYGPFTAISLKHKAILLFIPSLNIWLMYLKESSDQSLVPLRNSNCAVNEPAKKVVSMSQISRKANIVDYNNNKSESGLVNMNPFKLILETCTSLHLIYHWRKSLHFSTHLLVFKNIFHAKIPLPSKCPFFG